MVVHVYDKGKYHDETVEEEGLPEEYAVHHLVYALRWFIDRDLVSEEFTTGEGAEAFERYRRGEQSIFWLFEWWDRVLSSDLLSTDGNAFARDYLDYDDGRYLEDYAEVLQGDLPSEFHVPWTEENYRILAERCDARYEEWSRRVR